MSMWVIKLFTKFHWVYWCPHLLDHGKGIYGNTKMFTEGKVFYNSENGHGYMVTSLMMDECDSTFLTKFLKQVVFLLLGVCLSLWSFNLYLWIVLVNNLHLYEFHACIQSIITLQMFIVFIVMLHVWHPVIN